MHSKYIMAVAAGLALVGGHEVFHAASWAASIGGLVFRTELRAPGWFLLALMCTEGAAAEQAVRREMFDVSVAGAVVTVASVKARPSVDEEAADAWKGSRAEDVRAAHESKNAQPTRVDAPWDSVEPTNAVYNTSPLHQSLDAPGVMPCASPFLGCGMCGHSHRFVRTERLAESVPLPTG
jgi:hypothetical protein